MADTGGIQFQSSQSDKDTGQDYGSSLLHCCSYWHIQLELSEGGNGRWESSKQLIVG